MIKKLLFLALILSVIGGGFWYFWFNFGQKAMVNGDQTNLLKQENSVGIITEPGAEYEISAEPVANENQDLKALAMKIIERPIIFKDQLSDSAKKRITDKLNEIMSIIQQNYDYPNPWYDLGAYRRSMGDYEGAIEAWNFVGLIRPHDYIFYNNLGDLYGFELKDYKKGEDNFLKAIVNNSGNINGYIQLATLYEYVYKEKSAEAENILLLGIQSNPKDAELKIILAQYYERNDRKVDALKYFEEALILDPRNNQLQEEVDRLKNS